MQLSFAAPNSAGSGVGAIVVGALDGATLTASAARLDKEAGGAISRALGFSKFKGKPAQMLELLAPAGVKASRIIVIGLGKASDFGASTAENLAATVTGRLLGTGETQATFEIDLPKGSKL